VRTRSSTVLIT